ncbi:hypothetical protein SO694_0051000, partial [Aureococcus anophagefferens]
LKRHKAAAPFKAPVDVKQYADYVPRLADAKGPGQPMDLNKLEVRHRSGVYRRDVGAWVRDARRIAANCLRYNVDVRFPELRNAGRAWLAAVEKEVEHKLRPALRAAGATDVELDKAVPRLLPRYEKILSAVEDAVLNVYDGGVQRCYAFISPITAYYDAREQGQKRTLDDYLRAVPEPMCVNEVFRRLLEGDYKRPDDVARDVELIFANCRAYYGPRGSGRVLHGDADADAYCELAKLFSARWKAKLPDLAKAPAKRDDRRPSPSSKPPAAKPPPKARAGSSERPPAERPPALSLKGSVGQQAAKILDALRAVKHPDGQEAALGFLHENMLPPEQGEYATAIGGAHNARDFNRIEAKARGGGYRNLQAFGDDVAKCFANARAWKARVEFLHRGSPEAWCSQKPIAGAIVEGADLLAPLLRTYLAEAPVEAPKSVPKLKIKKLARPPPPPSALAQSAAHVAAAVAALPGAAREKYLALAAFPDDCDLPAEALDLLFGAAADDVLETLCARSLLRRLDGRAYGLHDLQLDWLRKQRAPEEAHAALLDAVYGGLARGSSAYPRDGGHLARHGAFHFRGAGRARRLAELYRDLAFVERLLEDAPVDVVVADAEALLEGGALEGDAAASHGLVVGVLRLAAAALRVGGAGEAGFQ